MRTWISGPIALFSHKPLTSILSVLIGPLLRRIQALMTKKKIHIIWAPIYYWKYYILQSFYSESSGKSRPEGILPLPSRQSIHRIPHNIEKLSGNPTTITKVVVAQICSFPVSSLPPTSASVKGIFGHTELNTQIISYHSDFIIESKSFVIIESNLRIERWDCVRS